MLWDDYEFLCSEWARSNHRCRLSPSVRAIKTFPFAVQPGCTGMQVPAKFRGGKSLGSLGKKIFLWWNPALRSGVSPLAPFVSIDMGTVFCGRAGVERCQTHAKITSFLQTIMHPYHCYLFKNMTKVASFCGPDHQMWLWLWTTV